MWKERIQRQNKELCDKWCLLISMALEILLLKWINTLKQKTSPKSALIIWYYRGKHSKTYLTHIIDFRFAVWINRTPVDISCLEALMQLPFNTGRLESVESSPGLLIQWELFPLLGHWKISCWSLHQREEDITAWWLG